MNMALLPELSVAAGILSLCCLIVLHIASPEFEPKWRMVSEYALGRHTWLLTTFFYLWGTSSVLLVIDLMPTLTSILSYVGALMLLLSGVGAILGGMFDVQHPRHGLAFGLGVPTLPVAAVILTYSTFDDAGQPPALLILIAHGTWISLILMAAAMMTMFAGFKKAGVEWGKDAPPPDHLPDGVIALGGYANRLLVVSYIAWVVIMASTR